MKKTRKSKSGLLTQPFKFQPGLVLGVLGMVFLGGGVLLSANASNTTTVKDCKPMAVTNISTASPTADQVVFTVSSHGAGATTTAAVKAGANCVGPLISLVSYQATATNGLPRNKQTIFDSQTKALAQSVVDLSVNVPDCFYQTDLAYGQPLDLTTGVDYSDSVNFLWGVTGGSQSCPLPATPTPSPSSTPAVTATATSSPAPTRSPSPSASPTPAPTDMPTASPSPTATPGSGGSTATPKPTATPVIPLGPGEHTPPTITQTNVLPFLPQTGQPGSFMSFLGALLVTAGLFHIYLTQRRKLLKTSKAR